MLYGYTSFGSSTGRDAEFFLLILERWMACRGLREIGMWDGIYRYDVQTSSVQLETASNLLGGFETQVEVVQLFISFPLVFLLYTARYLVRIFQYHISEIQGAISE